MKQNWTIEYEIPPLRAIYFAEADDHTEDEVREHVRQSQPLWRIRKLTVRQPHPEDKCQSCSGTNFSWFAPSPLWNEIVGSPNLILCPNCFIAMANAQGFTGTWKLSLRDD